MAVLIPQFPLEIIAFPGLALPLHIFEPRYKQLFQDCIRDNLKFGIIPVIDGVLQKRGTRMKIRKVVREYEDGRLDVICEGLDLFRVIDYRSEADGRLYPEATVESIVCNQEEDEQLSLAIQKLLKELFQLMKIAKTTDQVEALTPFQIAKMIGLSMKEEYQLIELDGLASRQRRIVEHLSRIIPRVREAEKVRRHLEMNGQFLHLQPPEI